MHIWIRGMLTAAISGQRWHLTEFAAVGIDPHHAGSVNVTISGAANDSGAITQNYAAGASLTLSVQTAAAGCKTALGC